MSLIIRTNRQYRNTLMWYELSAKEQAAFDYLTEDSRYDTNFIRYRGVTYDLGEFIRAPEPFLAWHGYRSDSFYSGVLIRYSTDHEQVVMGTYIA